MNVFAAASLTEAFPRFDGGQKYNFAGTDALAAQIRLGAPADVFAGASPDAPQALFRAGLVEQPRVATNKLVLAVPTANPAGIKSVYDLQRPGIKLIIGTATVPIGAYTRQVLGYLGFSRARRWRNVVSLEQNVNAISAKLALGTADAGFMYVTDARSRCGQGHRHPASRLGRSPRCDTRSRSSRSTKNHADAAAFIKRLDEHRRPQAAGRQRVRRAQAAAEGQDEEEEDVGTRAGPLPGRGHGEIIRRWPGGQGDRQMAGRRRLRVVRRALEPARGRATSSLAGRPGRAPWVDVGCGTGAFWAGSSARAAPGAWAGSTARPSSSPSPPRRSAIRVPGWTSATLGRCLSSTRTSPAPCRASRSTSSPIRAPAAREVRLRDPARRDGRRLRLGLRRGNAGGSARFWDAAIELDAVGARARRAVRFPLCAPERARAMCSPAPASCRSQGGQRSTSRPSFADFDDYWTPFLRQPGPAPGYCASLPADQREELRARLLDRLSPSGRPDRR